eukprot:scaffold4399_cov18-Tisochrysis_lutea.AAC.1
MHRGHNAIPDMPPGGHVSSAAAHGHPAQAECTELFTCPHPHRLLPPPLLSHTRSISKSGTFLLQLSCPRRQVGCKASGGFESLAAWGCLPLPLSGPLQLPTHTGGSAWARGAAACNAAGSTARLALLSRGPVSALVWPKGQGCPPACPLARCPVHPAAGLPVCGAELPAPCWWPACCQPLLCSHCFAPRLRAGSAAGVEAGEVWSAMHSFEGFGAPA